MKNPFKKHVLTTEEKSIIYRRHRLIYAKGTAINPVAGYEELLKKYPDQVSEYMNTLSPNYQNTDYYLKGIKRH